MHKLAFLGRAWALGVTIEDCRNLLSLWENQNRGSADVRAIVAHQLEKIEAKIKRLEAMRDTFS